MGYSNGMARSHNVGISGTLARSLYLALSCLLASLDFHALSGESALTGPCANPAPSALDVNWAVSQSQF